MFTIFQDFHWPTFFFSLILFIIVSNLFAFIGAYLQKKRSEAKLKQMDKKLEDMFQKLKAEDQKIDEIIKKFESSSK